MPYFFVINKIKLSKFYKNGIQIELISVKLKKRRCFYGRKSN